MTWTASSPGRRYLFGAVLTIASVLARLALNPIAGHRFPYTTAVIGVLAAAALAGAGPAAIVGVGAPAILYFLIGDGDIGRLLSAQVVMALIVWVIAQLQRAHRQAAESARLADERLEQLRLESIERAREARHSSHLRAVVESSEDAIIAKDLSGIVQSWNHAAEQMFGYTAAEMQGKTLSGLIPPDLVQEEADMLDRIRRGGRVKHFETLRRRKDGQQIHVSLTVSPIRDSTGQIIGISDIARDITEGRALEEQLQQTQRLESLGVLAGGMAHHFNNLLTGIVGNASLVLEEADTPGMRSRLREILQGGERAAVLIRQMLAYAGKGRFVVEKLDLSASVEEIADLLRNSIPSPVKLDLQLARDLPPVEGDRSQMQQLIMNLALNAAEAIDDRSGTVTITTARRHTEAEDQVVLEVIDTGCGMDESTKARIFDPFFTTKFPGRGLGLAAVAGILRSQKGSITVQTAPGDGSKFTVVLPSGGRQKGLDPRGTEVRGNGHLLIVDNEELTRNMARFALERCGYTVQLANDGQAAVRAFAADPAAFSGVLLDLSAALMNGEETLERMRKIHPGVRVVLSCHDSEMEASRRFQDRQVAGFLQKPYTPTALARNMKQALRAE